MEVTGKVFKYGDNVDTDVIIPARYLNTSDPKELASHCMEDIDSVILAELFDKNRFTLAQKYGVGLYNLVEHSRFGCCSCIHE